MKVLILAKNMEMGGTEIALLALLTQLVKDENSVDLMLLQSKGVLLDRVPKEVSIKEFIFRGDNAYKKLIGISDNYSLLDKIKCKYVRNKCNREKTWNKAYNCMLESIEPYEKEYDWLLDFHGYGYFMTAYGARKVYAKKKVLWFHDENLWWIEKITDYIDDYDRLLCVSKAVKVALDKVVPTLVHKTEVLLNCIDVENIRKKAIEESELSDFSGIFKILTIGRLEEQKGIDFAIRVAKRLKDSGIHFTWYVIGDGSEKTCLLEQIENSELCSEFVLLGTKMNPYPYIDKCNLYVQPSRHEGYPITIIEARALCKTIVATDINSIQEQIVNNKNGYLVPMDERLFCDKIKQLILHPELISNIEKNLQQEDVDYSNEYFHFKKIMETI